MSSTAPVNIDWDALQQEAVRLLSEYLTVDTSNPPGNEALAARWLGEWLRGEGIGVELFESAPGRESLIARLPGSDGSAPWNAVVLLNHTDVVPAQAEYWSVPPFAGVIRDGCVWGRGAQDTKGLGIIELLTFVLFQRLKLPHRRELVFFAIADEEAGGEYGVEWFAKHHPDQLRAYVVINEGASCVTDFLEGNRPMFGIAAAEKTPLWLRLRTEGKPGHGSMPHDDNALVRLVTALGKVNSWKRERRIVPEVARFFDGLAAAAVMEPIIDVAAAERAASMNPLVNALTMDTISITSCTAGVKVNVIPASCEATLDCRLLPGKRADEFTAELAEQIDDPRVVIERIFSAEGPSAPLDHELFGVVGQVAREHLEDAVVVPTVCVGFTDSRTFRELGTPAYGFSPALTTQAEWRTVHGHDERISIEGLRVGLQILFEVVRRLAT